MHSVAEEPLNLDTFHFEYITSEQVRNLDALKSEAYDVIIAFPELDGAFRHTPFKYDANIHEASLQKTYSTLAKFSRAVKKTGTLYVYGTPQLLPYLSVYLDTQGWQFKYWIALETTHPEPSNAPILATHEGMLLYVRSKNKFSLRKVRSEHQRCDVCGDFTADWGGKKHLRHKLGYAISDVWDDLPEIKDARHVLSKEVWQRLILLTASDHSRILCAHYDGEQDLEQFIFE